MHKIIIFGNSGSGKTTLAKQLSSSHLLPHFDLDVIAWQPTTPPLRMPIAESEKKLDNFFEKNTAWIIEGCYADLLELAIPHANQIIFLNLPIETCVENARKRPWEPHKYQTPEAQDANLAMLVDWIKQYDQRTDTFSKAAHEALFDGYSGKKIMYTSNNHKHLIE